MNIFTILTAVRAIIDPAKWKQRQVNINQFLLVLGLATGLLKGTQYEIPDSLVASIGAALFGLINWGLTIATTDKVSAMGRPTLETATPTGHEGAGVLQEESGAERRAPPAPETDLPNPGA